MGYEFRFAPKSIKNVLHEFDTACLRILRILTIKFKEEGRTALQQQDEAVLVKHMQQAEDFSKEIATSVASRTGGKLGGKLRMLHIHDLLSFSSSSLLPPCDVLESHDLPIKSIWHIWRLWAAFQSMTPSEKYADKALFSTLLDFEGPVNPPQEEDFDCRGCISRIRRLCCFRCSLSASHKQRQTQQEELHC